MRASLLIQLSMTREITATEQLPFCPHTQHTRSNMFVLCSVQTWTDIKPPSGPLICSQLAITEKIKLFCDFVLTSWQFLQFPTLKYWPLREKDRKLQSKAVTPHLSGGSTHFRYFHPLWSNGVLWKGPYATMGLWWYDLECVCCVPPLTLRTPFRLLSPHQPTHTWLRPLGHTLLRIDVFYCTTSICSCVCMCVLCLYVMR